MATVSEVSRSPKTHTRDFIIRVQSIYIRVRQHNRVKHARPLTRPARTTDRGQIKSSSTRTARERSLLIAAAPISFQQVMSHPRRRADATMLITCEFISVRQHHTFHWAGSALFATVGIWIDTLVHMWWINYDCAACVICLWTRLSALGDSLPQASIRMRAR